MAYTWTNGEFITADKLNATGDGFIVVHISEDEEHNFVVDKTYAEIAEAFETPGVAIVAVGFGILHPYVSPVTVNEEEAYAFYGISFDEDDGGVDLKKTGISISESNVVDFYYESVTVEQIIK